MLLIKTKNTYLREAITPHERLTATLWYSATAQSYEDLKYFTIISSQLLGKIIPETYHAIYEILKDTCVHESKYFNTY